MGSSFKSSNSHGQRGNNINKPYAVMLLLVFGAAILGVMVLHKLREKRIFTLLVKQKDHELLTLHLLFQREKEFNQEARKKIEEMKNTAYSLRTQKLGLDRRVAEMESTISALKDERKVIELTLEEGRNEIQMLTAAMNSSAGDPAQVTALKSMIKMKDEEIEDLKLRFRNLDVRSETGGNDGQSQLKSDSFGDSTKGESRSQNDGSDQREGEHITDVEPNKLNDVTDATAIERENIGNEERERDFHGEQDGNIEEAKSKVISGNDREEEQRKVRENGSTVRRKHSQGKRREIQRNRRLEDDLYSVSKTESTPALTIDEQQKFERNKGESALSENKKELGRSKFQTERSNIYHNTETMNDGMYREEEVDKRVEETERNSAEKKINGTKAEQIDEHRKSMNAETKLIHETNNQLNKQEKMHSNEARKHEKENEHGNEIANEESEDEDSEDAETREPEIDGEDIKRFSESDPYDEAEETEF